MSEELLILMADDDEDDCLMAKEAFEEAHVVNELRFVHDGQELMDYLKRRGKYADPAVSPRPGLILLDLNMPRKDGREALKEIKADPELRSIPVVILTTSRAEEDILNTYSNGANSFITKPVTFEGLVKVIREIDQYWFKISIVPEAVKRGQKWKS